MMQSTKVLPFRRETPTVTLSVTVDWSRYGTQIRELTQGLPQGLVVKPAGQK